MKRNMTKVTKALALAAGVSMLALAPAAAMQDAEAPKAEKKVVIKEKGDKENNAWVTKDGNKIVGERGIVGEMISKIVVKNEDGDEQTITVKRVNKDGEVTVDVEGGELVETSEDGNTFKVKDENGKIHTINLVGDGNMLFVSKGAGGERSFRVLKDGDKMSWVDEDGNVKKLDGEMRFEFKGDGPMKWTSKDGDDVKVFMSPKAPMTWSKMRAPMIVDLQMRDDKREEALAKIDEALANIEQKLSSLSDKKRNRDARAALETAADSLRAAREAMETDGENVFEYRTQMRMMDKDISKQMKKALENLKVQEGRLVELDKEMNIELDMARDELKNIIVEIKNGDGDGEIREIKLRALEEAQIDLESMEEERLEALTKAQENLERARKELEKKIKERKKKEESDA